MPRVLTVDGSVKIGAYHFPDRKTPVSVLRKEIFVRCTALSLTLAVQTNL